MTIDTKERRLATARQAAAILKKRRRAKGLSQTDLAFKLGLSQARISAIENDAGSLTIERLIALANVLDLEVVLRDRARNGGTPEW